MVTNIRAWSLLSECRGIARFYGGYRGCQGSGKKKTRLQALPSSRSIARCPVEQQLRLGQVLFIGDRPNNARLLSTMAASRSAAGNARVTRTKPTNSRGPSHRHDGASLDGPRETGMADRSRP